MSRSNLLGRTAKEIEPPQGQEPISNFLTVPTVNRAEWHWQRPPVYLATKPSKPYHSTRRASLAKWQQ
jgi:hypothetical protein